MPPETQPPPSPLPPLPRVRRMQRVLLVAIVTAFVLLAVNQSALMPLWETPDENEHCEVIDHWLRHGSMPDLTNLPMLGMNEGVQPPLAYWTFALAARAAGLQDVRLLPRRRFDKGWMEEGELLFLHGPDELFPFAGPARRLHLLRLLSVLCGAVTVAGAFALGRRLLPGSGTVPLVAAGLVAFNPAFIQRSAGISNDPFAVALCTLSLVALADLCRHPAPGARRCLATGLIIGLAHVSKLSASFLLPLVPLALLLRRPRGEPWSRSLLHLDLIVAGFLLPAGPFFAWNIATYGDPVAWGWLQAKFDVQRQISVAEAIFLRFLPEVVRTYVLNVTTTLSAGFAAALAWTLAVATGLIGLLLTVARRMPAAGAGDAAPAGSAALPAPASPARGLLLLLACGVLVNLITGMEFYLEFNQPQARYLHPSIAAFTGLLAVGWWRLLPAAVSAAGVLALALTAFHAQTHVLGPTCWPPNRVHDPHLLCFDPLEAVPPERRLDTLSILSPASETTHSQPPTLRWDAPDDLSVRYTVHLSTPGLTTAVRTYEQQALSVRDRYDIPPATWYGLPPRLSLVCRIVRLPTLDEALYPPPGGLFVEQSPPIVLRRGSALPPSR